VARSAAGPLPLLTAVPGPEEAQLVAHLGGVPGVVVVRRCADLGELLSASAAGHGRAALVSADLHRLDRDALARLAAAGTAVVGVLPPAALAPVTAGAAAARLTALGVRHQVDADAPGRDVAAAALAAVTDLADGGSADDGERGTSPWEGQRTAARTSASPFASTPVEPVEPVAPSGGPVPAPGRAAPVAGSAAAVPRPLTSPEAAPAPPPAGVPGVPGVPGRLVAVWGAPGAPGRTSVATNLAAELALLGERVVLVDADTWSSSTAQVLGLLDETAGVAAACRAAAAGTLTPGRLLELAPAVLPGLAVLTGLPRAERWHELGAAALEELWGVCRATAAWTVVDVAHPLEQDEELVLDTAAPRRNAATTTALAAADLVLVVGQADPVGLQRLVRALGDLAEAQPRAAQRRRVVVTRVRASAVGREPAAQVAEALARYAGVVDAVLVPDDRPACDAALLGGRTLAEAAPGSPARAALAALAGQLAAGAGRAPARPRRHRWARMRA